MLEAYDLTGGYRAAAALVGCDHTGRRHVRLRASGNPSPEQVVRPRMVDEHMEKIEEMVEKLPWSYPRGQGARPVAGVGVYRR